MRTLCLIAQIGLAPWLIINFFICVWGAMAVLGLTEDADFPLDLLPLVVGVGAWAGNAATVKVLTEQAPAAWMRLLWLPGTLFTLVVTFTFYATIEWELSSSTPKLFWPTELLARTSVVGLVVAAAFTLLTVGSPAAMVGLQRLRKAAKRNGGQPN